MRLIDADALWMDVIHSMDYCDDILEMIESQPTIVQESQWIPMTKEEVLQTGYEGREVRFHIGGRLFAIRELAQ